MFKKTLCSLFMLGGAGMLFALPPHLGKADYPASSINNFDFNLSWENLQLESTSGHEIVVDIYCNKKKFAPKVKLTSDTLVIESIPTGVKILSIERKNCTVIVKVPDEKRFDKVKLHTSSGDIKSSVVFSADEIYLEASSGNIKMEKQISSSKEALIKTSSGDSFVDYVQTGKLSVQASSGNIRIDAGSAKNLSLSASSGNIACSNFSGGDSLIKTTSGNIKLKNFEATDFESSASSGSITAQDLSCQSFNVSTSSGTIGLELTDSPVKNSSASSSSGTQYISMPKGSGINLRVTTSRGGFTNTFTKEKISSHADYNNAINGGGAKVNFSSTSGSITLDVGSGVASRGGAEIYSDDDTSVVNVDRPIF